VAVACDQSGADDQAEYRSAMVAAARTHMPSVLGKPRPEFRARARLQRMRANTYDARSQPCIAAGFTRLPEEINTPLRPSHPAVALREHPRAAEGFFKLFQQAVEAFQMLFPTVGHVVSKLFRASSNAARGGKVVLTSTIAILQAY
jgi:hypothetical protein